MADFETRIVMGWRINTEEEKERFNEATNYRYEDNWHAPDYCMEPYILGDDIITIPAGTLMDLYAINKIIQTTKVVPLNITPHSVTVERPDWTVKIANAGYTCDSVLFDPPQIYILSCIMY